MDKKRLSRRRNHCRRAEPELRNELQRNADVVLIGSIDEAIPLLKSYDLILLLDVLEHLPDSTKTLRELIN